MTPFLTLRTSLPGDRLDALLYTPGRLSRFLPLQELPESLDDPGLSEIV